jgi:hypothetical protein
MIGQPSFLKLNEGWNAEPNAPDPVTIVIGHDVVLRFLLNSLQFQQFAESDLGILRFRGCSRFRLGPTNDEGWYRGQCRYSRVAPDWGEFYEVVGDDPFLEQPVDWRSVSPTSDPPRHFLFYFRDRTFECMAQQWEFDSDPANKLRSGR